MSDARVTLVFDGTSDGAVSAADETAVAVAEVKDELQETATSSAEVSKGMLDASVKMEAVKKAAQLLGRGLREVISSSEELQQIQSALGQAYRETRDALGSMILTQSEAQSITSTLAAVTQTVTQRVREGTAAQGDYSRELAGRTLDAALALIDVVQALSTGYTGVRVAILAARLAVEEIVGAFVRFGTAVSEGAMRALGDFRDELSNFATFAGPAIGAVFGGDAQRSLSAFAEGQREAAQASRETANALRVLGAEQGEIAARTRGEYLAALQDVEGADASRRTAIAEVRKAVEGLRAQIADGTITEYEFAESLSEVTRVAGVQREEIDALTESLVAQQKASAELARLRQENEVVKARMAAEELQVIEAERQAWLDSLAQKDLERQMAQTAATKQALAEQAAAEQEAAQARLRSQQAAAGTLARIGASAIATQGDVAENFRATIAAELSARGIQWAVEAVGRFAAFDFVGGSLYTAAAAAAVTGARLLGGSPSAAGQVSAQAPSTQTSVTNISTEVGVSGIVTPDAVPLVARAVTDAQRQGLI